MIGICVICRTSVSNLNHKLDSLQLSNVLAKEELDVAKKNIEQLQQENSALKADNSNLSDLHHRHVQVGYVICIL